MSAALALLSHAGTDLAALSRARWPEDFPSVSGISLQGIADEAAMQALLDGQLAQVRAIVLRVLGRADAIPGLELLLAHARRLQAAVIVLSGTGEPDPELQALCSAPVSLQQDVHAYLQAGGSANLGELMRCLADRLLLTGFGYQPPLPLPEHGVYHPELSAPCSLADWLAIRNPDWPTVGLCFYRAHWLSGNTRFIDLLVDCLAERGVNALPVFTSSLRTIQDGGLPAALALLADPRAKVSLLINTTSFAMGDINNDGPTQPGWAVEASDRLNLPVLQAITSSMTREQWEASDRGFNPLDTAMNVALPEFDGRIIGVPLSFKQPAMMDQPGQAEQYAPLPDRARRLAGIAARLARLRHVENADKRIAFIFTNSNSKASQIGNAVGLDSPASLYAMLRGMQGRGYQMDPLPPDSDALMHELIDRGAYDQDYLSAEQMKNAAARVPAQRYQAWFDELPDSLRDKMLQRWGQPPGGAYVDGDELVFSGLDYGHVFVALQPPRGYGMDPDAIYHTPDLPPTHHYYALYRWLRDDWRADAIVHVGKHGTLEWLPGKGVGLSQNCFPDALLGDMPLFYPFIVNDPGEGSQAKRRGHAVIIDHLTPTMTTADSYGPLAQLTQLVDEYYQVELLDPNKLPLLQQQIWDLIKEAKLDTDLAAMLKHDHEHEHGHEHEPRHDHEHPHPHGGHHHAPAAVHGKYRPQAAKPAAAMKPAAAAAAKYRPAKAAHGHDHGHHHHDHEHHGHHHDHHHHDHHGHSHSHDHHDHDHDWDDTLNEDGVPLSLAKMDGVDVAHLIEDIDGYLCELGAAQIRDGLHVLGNAPQGEALVDMLLALTRLPNLGIPGLPASVAAACGGDWTLWQQDQGKRLAEMPAALQTLADQPLVTRADAHDAVLKLARGLIADLAARGYDSAAVPAAVAAVLPGIEPNADLERVLTFVCAELCSKLARTAEEIDNLLRGLEGGYVPAGPSGAPTRGMAHILPTGRNFYSVDPRSLPSNAAWRIGDGLAREMLARHLKETGQYPESVAISVWGTSAMRTHGDDIAEILSLLGVKPRWQQESRRVQGLEVIPLAELGRPRIDVTVRISGFFRDAFPHLIALIDEAVHTVARLDEPLEQNFLRKHYLADLKNELLGALPDADAHALYRVFGAKPGSYGAGILPLINEQNWQNDADFATAYVNWGGYAYGREANGADARDALRHRLAGVEVALHNQDNREHDIFDSDDYLQYHGGMIATIRSLSGRQPRAFFGDSHNPEAPAVRGLKEEVLRVFRSRVANPKWIAGIQKHGYKGALELTATVDYLFGYDATAQVVDDWVYEQLAQSYALDPAMQQFFANSNPWALNAITDRLLEAAQRQLWAEPDPETLAALRQLHLDSEALLEARGENKA
ncbi:cobaltochelatase subunit CobN [Chromobacterium sp. Panama]|uniref:cobaltochelatase subunit CobN n=1 Tax=Chromobacterium sp. Panama TaxID=2161826 RepID=UPI000D310B89|nr:cobaltochelatase subunit CobN [Chromobacterium sp. Panama]PTU65962.1 cobaltochelatase subunit CobN [Chromobacterium sp. Panama]